MSEGRVQNGFMSQNGERCPSFSQMFHPHQSAGGLSSHREDSYVISPA